MSFQSHPKLALYALAVVAGTGAGCAGIKGDAAGSATGGGGTSGCQTSACVPPLTTHVIWAIEIDPLSSAPAALTELPSVDVAAMPLVLMADSLTAVSATFTGGASNPVPTTANVVLTIPSQISGRPDLTFESAAALDKASGAIAGSLEIPSATIARSAGATLQLLPLSPADQQSPPASFPVVIASSFSQTLPTNNLSISGTLLSALNVPLPASSTFVARAFLGGIQVSNAPLIGSDGTFQLLVAPAAAGASVIVELTPQNQLGSDPWYTSSPIPLTANLNLPPINFPAYSMSNVFTLTVQGADDPGTGVSGAFVRAQTIVASSATGATDFLRDGTTSAKTATSPGGMVTLSLLPGTAGTPLEYNLTVIPPASSPYATSCLSPVGVTVGGTLAAPSSLLTIPLTRRSVLTGTVLSAMGEPVANVAITATAGPAPTPACVNTNTPAVSSSTLAGLDGTFTLPLDPGTYQLDYDPPAGAPVPRLTETITIPPGGGQIPGHLVTLPEPARVEGKIYQPDGSTPLPSATVRIFEVHPGPMPAPPLLVAQTVSDGTGTFRAVVAAPVPGN